MPPLLARVLSESGSDRWGGSNVSLVSPVAILATCTAHATGSVGRHSPLGLLGIEAECTTLPPVRSTGAIFKLIHYRRGALRRPAGPRR